MLRAKDAPFVIILRRKPSKQFHVIRWNTETGEVEHGSWFQGKLYSLRCDVSPDGKWMAYLAMGASGETWTGVCRPPWLRTAVHWENSGTWHGGGWWLDEKTLIANPGYAAPKMEIALSERKGFPFKIETRQHPFGEDEGVLYFRLVRDGFVYQGAPAPKTFKHPAWMFRAPTSLDGWKWRFSENHPELWIYQNKYSALAEHFDSISRDFLDSWIGQIG